MTSPEPSSVADGRSRPADDLRRALAYVRPHWRRLVLVVAVSILSTALALALPYLSKTLVDRALLGRDLTVLGWTIAGFLAMTAASYGLNVVSGLRYTRVSADILFEMRLAVFEHLQRLSPRFFARMPLGQIASRINGDIGEIQRVASEVVLAWLGHLVFLVGSVVMLLVLDPLLFAVSLVALPGALWVLVTYRRRLEGAVAVVRDRGAVVGSFLVEALQGMKLVAGLNAQAQSSAGLAARNASFVEGLMRMRRLTYLAGGGPGLLLALGSAAVFFVGGWRVIDGAITMGTLVAFLAYQMRLLGPIQGLMGLYTSVASVRVSLRRVAEILDTPPEVTDGATAVPMATVRGDLRLERVTFSFDRGEPVLHDASASIEAGEHVALVGESGHGKSTIADLLTRHFDPAAGRITLDGRDLRDMPLRDVRRHIVAVEHQPFIFNASIADNLRLARPQATREDLDRVVEASGLGALVHRLPLGLETVVGERGSALSAGERQRLAIARALLADPAVLILDEATASLDQALESRVVSAYEELWRGRTMIVITHRATLAERADRVLRVERGALREDAALMDTREPTAPAIST
jgi:ATP-binding cassette subfamily B protein